jgi:hemerythrin-like domain-containing protein
MTPTDRLRDEHRVILGALDLLERAATGRRVPEAWWASVVAWLRAFADRSHHAKEETALFPAMIKAGVPSDGGPIAVMLEEHVEGRRLVAAIEAGMGAARLKACRDYVALLRAHIEKENGIVFPLADGVLDERAMAGLAREFDAVEAEQGAIATVSGGETALARLATGLDAAG